MAHEITSEMIEEQGSELSALLTLRRFYDLRQRNPDAAGRIAGVVRILEDKIDSDEGKLLARIYEKQAKRESKQATAEG